MPRSATTWVFNVIDRIARSRQIVCTKVNANSPLELDKAVKSYRDGQNVLVHFHDVTPTIQAIARKQFTKVFFCYRDPRDIVVSQMRLHNASFEHSIKMTLNACHSFLSALEIFRVLLVPYFCSMRHREAVVYSIAFHMGIVLRETEVERICEETSIDKYKRVMKSLHSENANMNTIFTGNRRIKYDPETFINDRHIQSGKIGRWKDELEEEQQRFVCEIFKDFVEKVI